MKNCKKSFFYKTRQFTICIYCSMKTIALCMIVKNEEKTLSRILAPLSSVVDQIVIVDTGSTDGTVNVAKCWGAEVHFIPWRDDFAAARNFAFEKSRCDYNLWLDADDVMTQESITQLLHLKKELTGQTDAYFFRYNVAFDESGVPTFSYFRERLLKNNENYRFCGRVHEAVSCMGRTEFLPITIEHRPEKKNKDPYRNVKIYRKMRAEGVAFSARDEYYYGRELYSLGKRVAAKKILTAFLKRQDAWSQNKIEALSILSAIATQEGRGEDAKRLLLQTFLYAPPRVEVCYDLATLFFVEQNYLLAIQWYLHALSQPPSLYGFQEGQKGGLFAALQLTVCYDRQNNRPYALAYHLLAEGFSPNHPSVLANAAYFSATEEEKSAAKALIQSLKNGFAMRFPQRVIS